jgi:hypothetical protein
MIIAFAIIALIALNYWLFTKVFRQTTPIEKSAVLIASGETSAVYPYADGVIAVTDKEATCYNHKGEKLFTTTLPTEGMKAYRNGKNTICWVTNIVVVIDDRGEIIITKQLEKSDTKILMATCNSSQFAVGILQEQQSWVRVFNFQGAEIASTLYPDQSILGIGYFGEKDEQLWTLAMDYHGTLPITKINTNHPGNSQTGYITLNGEIAYDLVPLKDSVYIVGTHHIQSRTYTDTAISQMLINGWSLQDYLVGDNDDVSFLMAPVDTTGYDVPLSAVWYITPNGEQYRISMPAGVIKAVLTKKKIYAISPEGIYSMQFNGKKRNFSKLPFIIDKVIGVSAGKAVVVKSGLDYYTIALN